jgi:hypothetical protein
MIEQMTPRQALEVYLRDKETTPARVDTLLKHFDKLQSAVAESARPTGD